MSSPSTEPTDLPPPLAGVIAIVGCDGSGKSRLTNDLLALLQDSGPVERRYLGLVSGESGDKIKDLPLIGVRLERFLAQRAHRAQDMKQKVPGPKTAVVMHLLSWWRLGQLRKVMRLSQAGVRVIADRFPQAEVAGFRYDGPGFAVASNYSKFMQRLVEREWRLYKRMAKQRPALVIRLEVDAETAHARKPDHEFAELRDKSAVMPLLEFNGARICDINARLEYEKVLEAATAAVREALEHETS